MFIRLNAIIFAGISMLLPTAAACRRCPVAETHDSSDGGSRPSLKYQLLPPYATRIHGNAAVYYGKVTAEQQAIFGNGKLINQIDDWRELPLADLRKPEIVMPSRTVEYMLARAARCDSCDWQLPIREEDFFNILLPEAQQTRQFGRILATGGIASTFAGRVRRSSRRFQSAFALAECGERRNVRQRIDRNCHCRNDDPAVGSVRRTASRPELVLALTTMPHPLVDLRVAIEGETTGMMTMFPEVQNLNANRTPDQWRQLLSEFWQKMVRYAGEANMPIGPADAMLEKSLRDFPESKQALMRAGCRPKPWTPCRRPRLYTSISCRFEEARDDRFEWLYVPYWQGVDRLKIDEAAEAADVVMADVPAKLFMPAVSAVRQASGRIEREFALMALVEALRLHGVTSGGRLPEHLADITVVPLPDDPVTGQPFVYRLEETTGVIELSPMPGRPTRWEIKMER